MNTLILISGIPGSGKTTLAKSISSDFTLHVDSIEALLNIHTKDQILSEFETLSQEIPNTNNQFQPKLWKESRQLAYQIIQQKLGSSKNKVFIIEDDFLLQSQRKEYRILCHGLNQLYIELQIEISLEKAFKRNQGREEYKQLSPDLIAQCFNKYELTDPQNFYPYKLIKTHDQQNEVQQFILDQILSPVIPQNNVQQTVKQQSDSIIHKTDLEIRKLISKLCQKYHPKHLSEIKNKFLKGKLSDNIEENVVQFLNCI